jgi:hypothetical protein
LYGLGSNLILYLLLSTIACEFGDLLFHSSNSLAPGVEGLRSFKQLSTPESADLEASTITIQLSRRTMDPCSTSFSLW